MTHRDHPVDEAIRRIAQDHLRPSGEERRLAEARLRIAIDAEQARSAPGLWRRRWAWAALAAAFAGLFVGLQSIGPTPTEAAMGEIASVVETIAPAEVGQQEFLYTESENVALALMPADALGAVSYDGEFLAYQLPSVRRTWFGADGAVQISTTNRDPVFFSEKDERAYYEAGLGEVDAIGETVTGTFRDDHEEVAWPTDPDDLDRALREGLAPETGRPESVDYLDSAFDLIREVFTSPELRAAVLTVIGRVPELELVEQTQDGATFTIEYQDRGLQTRLTFTISSRGELLAEETLLLEPDPELGIPAGTATFKAEYSAPEVVDSLDQP